MLRTIAALLLFFANSYIYASNPSETRYPRETISVDFLYESCSVVGKTAKGKIPFFDCESYVYGVLDSYLAIRNMIPKAKRACFPASLPPWQALEVAEPAVTAQGQSSRDAANVIVEALRRKYPCR